MKKDKQAALIRCEKWREERSRQERGYQEWLEANAESLSKLTKKQRHDLKAAKWQSLEIKIKPIKDNNTLLRRIEAKARRDKSKETFFIQREENYKELLKNIRRS